MQRILCLLLCVGTLLTGCTTDQGWQLAEGQHPQKHQKEIKKTVRSSFLLFLPEGFANADRKWPLIVFLHGRGEMGDDLEKLKASGLPKVVEADQQFPFIVVTPQIPHDPGFGLDALEALLDDVVRELPVDEDRIYLTGTSMGGSITWGWAIADPARFAAIAPIAAGWKNLKDACKVEAVPIWAFHGAKDQVVPVARHQQMVNAVRACGGDIRFTVYPNAGHDSWTQTYNNTELFDWFLSHQREP